MSEIEGILEREAKRLASEAIPRPKRPSILRATIRPLIPRLLGLNYSANQALQLLRSFGLGYRRKDFLDDWRNVKGEVKAANTAKFTPRKYAPSLDLMGQETHFTNKAYHYRVEVFYIDEETGGLTSRYVTVTTDWRITINQALDMAMDYVQEEFDTSQGYEEVHGTVTGSNFLGATYDPELIT